MKQSYSFSLACGIGTYLIWGTFPIFFKQLAPAQPLEAIVHRALWGLVTCLIYLAARKRLHRLIFKRKQDYVYLVLAGILIVVNWTTYVFTVLDGNTIAASIGYFITPLVTVGLGVVALGERLRPLQWVAVCLGAVAVLIMVMGSGHLPWVALMLAATFGTYGLLKKKVDPSISAVAGMTIETATVTPFLLIYFGYLWYHHETSIQVLASQGSPDLYTHIGFLITAGPLTVIPLVLFGLSAYVLPLRTMGMIQYISPSIQFLMGLWVFGETMDTARWAGVLVIWLALIILTAEGIWHGTKHPEEAKRTTPIQTTAMAPVLQDPNIMGD